MISQFFLAATVATFIYFSMSSSWASTKHHEVYPAVEDGASQLVEMPASPPTDIVTGAPAPAIAQDNEDSSDAAAAAREVQAQPVSHKRPVKHLRRKIAVARSESPRKYDLVPDSQIMPIIKRLKLVALILRDSGRAYDYRMFTVHQLEQILTKVEASKKKENS